MLKTIKLYGILAEKFGKQFLLEVESTREAMRALSVQFAGFEHFMLNAHHQGLRFAVWQDDHNISEAELDLNTGADVIKVVPVVEGAGGDNGVFQTILGAVMVVAGVVAMAYGQPWGGNLVGAGVGILVGGIAQMLMPKIDNSDQNQDGNKANMGFGGAVTTISQGNPVPVLYGQREIGGFIVSAGQYPEDQM